MTPSAVNDLSRKIKEFAVSIGFDLIGFAPAKQLSGHKTVLKSWLGSGMNADMHFISRNIEKRTDPSLLFEGARSVLVAGINYFPPERQGGNGVPVVSKYAYGNDYHTVVGDKLHKLLEFIIANEPAASGLVCVDSSPILEKAWAREAGLGWIGKNSILINKETGSFIFLGEIILNVELQYDLTFSDDLCGKCSLCIEACPTGAINENKTINARKCISWLTVENKNQIPEEYVGKLRNRIFGCDICQDICPWNTRTKPHHNPDLMLSDEIKKMSAKDWFSLSEESFMRLFSKSSVSRTTYKRLIRNINLVIPGNRSS